MSLISDSIARARVIMASLVAEIDTLEGHARQAPPAAPPAPPPPPPPPAPAQVPDAIGSAGAAMADAAPLPVAPSGFGDEAAFYDWLRDNSMLGPTISATEFKGCSGIARACAGAKWPISYTAYAFATAYLETAHSMMPVQEANWLSPAAQQAYFTRMYDITGQRPDKARELGNLSPGDGAKFCGRGYPQMTGRKNYQAAGTYLGVDLVGHPEKAMEPEIAAGVMIWGMGRGGFTGRRLSDYLPASGTATRAQFVPCRTIVNGHDREGDVADYAVNFQAALVAGKWRF